jgi:ankyrin repeat protein
MRRGVGTSRRTLNGDPTLQQRMNMAVKDGSLETVKRIFENDMKGDILHIDQADVDDERQQYAAHLACRHGRADILQYFKAIGADLVNPKTSTGVTPAFLAAQENFPECIGICLADKNKSISKDALNYQFRRAGGRTMLIAGVDKADGEKTTKFLISQAVNLNLTRVDNGYTAAMICADGG